MRLFTLGRKLPALSLDACHAHLAQRHASLVLGCRVFREHCLHYRQNHIQGEVDLAIGELRPQSDPAYHYCSEFWFEDLEALGLAYRDPGFLAVLRPDSKLWSDPLARVSLAAEDAWTTRPQQLPAEDGAVKLLVLNRCSTSLGDAAHAQERYRGFFDHCLRAACNVVSGQMDFAQSVVRDDQDVPFRTISEFWFASAVQAQAALGSQDCRRLVAQGSLFPAHPGDGMLLWATEHVVF